jgi:CYTH domain-containing protein
MKFQVTHPKIWEAVCEKSMPMKHKIKVYEKMGGAYRLGEDDGEQVFNTMTDLLKHKMGTSVNEGPETNDHEVSMAGGQLDDIIRNATELKAKVGEKEMDLPGWIQDHISQAQNFINQANTGFHELDQK